jgi:hypothetical protein
MKVTPFEVALNVDCPAGTDVFGYDFADRITMVDSTGTTSWAYNAACEQIQLATEHGKIFRLVVPADILNPGSEQTCLAITSIDAVGD